MDITSNQNKELKAATGTILFHAIILLLLFWWTFKVPVPAPVQELGIEVNLGNSDNGSGNDQPMSVEDPSAGDAANSEAAAAQASKQEADIIRSDEKDAPAINQKPKDDKKLSNKAETIKPKKTNNTQVAKHDPHRHLGVPLYAGEGHNGNNASQNLHGTSEGNTTGKGDRGVPGGVPGSANYTGSPGNGTGGISHTLTGRRISPDRFVAEFHEGGVVVVRVTVDRDGNIINKVVKSSPNSQLSKMALQKLSESKFSPNPNAAPEQFGLVTIVFKTH